MCWVSVLEITCIIQVTAHQASACFCMSDLFGVQRNIWYMSFYTNCHIVRRLSLRYLNDCHNCNYAPTLLVIEVTSQDWACTWQYRFWFCCYKLLDLRTIDLSQHITLNVFIFWLVPKFILK